MNVLLGRIKTAQYILLQNLLTVLFVPLAIFVRIIKPWRNIRVGYFITDRIGHWVFDLDYYLVSKQEAKNSEPESHDHFFLASKTPALSNYTKPLICNKQLESMTRRSVSVQALARYLYLANKWMPGGGSHSLEPARITIGSRDNSGILQKYPSPLSFTKDEHELGTTYLQDLGFSHDDRLVCLNVRDSAYLDQYYPRKKSWDYHNFRDCDIANYEEAVMWLVDRGFWVFRMGKAVKSECPFQHPRVVDYATTKSRSDFLDMWLISRCSFCISNSTGLDSVATAFRKPLLLIDFLPLRDFRHSEVSIGVPKRLLWKKSGAYFSTQEYFDHPYRTSHEYLMAEIEIRDLTSSEITTCTMEMVEYLDGKQISHENDDRTQRIFWEKFINDANTRPNPIWVHPSAKIGRVFFNVLQ